DDKSYPYIRLDDSHTYPGLSFYRGSCKEPGRYFGPFPQVTAVRRTLAELKKVFPVRQCEDSVFRDRTRPCLQYQIKRCCAPCVGLVSDAEYQEHLRHVRMFLEGRNRSLHRTLVEKMEEAAAALDYETALACRDQISALQVIQSRHQGLKNGGEADIFAVAIAKGRACVEVAFIRGGRLLGSRHFVLQIQLEETGGTILGAFLPQYYLHKAVPRRVMTAIKPENSTVLLRMLGMRSKKKVSLHCPQRGQYAHWLQLSTTSAGEHLFKAQQDSSSVQQRLQALQQVLGLDQPLRWIECFDISHTQGEKTVASCVVFIDGQPAKAEYRRFNIDGITAGDDYAAMCQVIERRFRKVNATRGKRPDLLLIDGGKGQLSRTAEVLETLGLSDIPIAGVVKGQGRKEEYDRLFLWGQDSATILSSHPPALFLAQQLRNEAHRFAITGHRNRRSKARKTSTLEAIPGVGGQRRKALLLHYGGLQGIKRAGVDSLVRVDGVSRSLAIKINEYFNS
ncbi:MAG TPA: excinuclease ABC subunit UvrC, partial [Gammaproteobacteria bacterium]|nr:excinuclease ABC subunit UvrC [Gammaproteobacteria bacterium]